MCQEMDGGSVLLLVVPCNPGITTLGLFGITIYLFGLLCSCVFDALDFFLLTTIISHLHMMHTYPFYYLQTYRIINTVKFCWSFVSSVIYLHKTG